jgi:putative tricarboxylic transport membrane protein
VAGRDSEGGVRRGEVLLAACVLALGLAFAAGAWLLPEAPGYARIGPRHFPALVAAGLVITGALLLIEALVSGYRHLPAEARGRYDWPAFLWVAGGLVAHMALIAGIGFVLAATLLFVCVARGFGSRRLLRDLLIGLALTAVVYLLFTRLLTLSLPWGAWLPALAATPGAGS